jgi:hypothetical protein
VIGDQSLCGLVGTGAKINMITDQAMQKIGTPILELPSPTQINLALTDKSRPPPPQILRQFTRATFADTHSLFVFEDVDLTLGPVAGK